MKQLSVHLIAAARPNFMKVAPLYHALNAQSWCEVSLIHTGQHYDPNMSAAFFDDLQLPAPDFHLEVGSGTHAQQTGGVMIAYEQICFEHRPDWIVVVGDVNSTVACAMVGAKLGIKVAHLEAGLRSGDRGMPEEINRILTDSIADLLWTPSPDGDEHLAAAGIAPERVELVGNIMIDSLELQRARIESDGTREALKLIDGQYAMVTMHRPSNVDDRATLTGLVEALISVSEQCALVFAVHPRTRKRLQDFELERRLIDASSVQVIEPLGYIQFMNLVFGARLIITDSGGIQEETTYLNIPCLTVRDNTERPITITQGTNRLVKPHQICESVAEIMRAGEGRGQRPQLWDGRTAQRVVASLKRHSAGL